MALSGFGKGNKDEAPAAAPATNRGGGGGFGNLTAFIDQGSEFEGKLSFKDTVRIDGCFSGEISSENTLIVGESGVIEADICSPTVVISGTVTGNVQADQKLVLHKSARMRGDVKTPSLIMEEGAALNGRVEMTRQGSSSKPAAASSADAPKPVGSKDHSGS